jgi:predicted RNA binding protein with dsRBD fold (UPF0201 family)
MGVKVTRPKAKKSAFEQRGVFTMTLAPDITVSTCVMPHEIGQRCLDAVLKIFPDFSVDNVPETEGFPVKRSAVDLVCEGVSPDVFLELLKGQRILDTALDAMSLNLRANSTSFLISRQAALSGKVAFVLESERTVGGTIEVELECNDLIDWMQEATWHSGRHEVPRTVGDELSMYSDGSAAEWFDHKGNATFRTED